MGVNDWAKVGQSLHCHGRPRGLALLRALGGLSTRVNSAISSGTHGTCALARIAFSELLLIVSFDYYVRALS